MIISIIQLSVWDARKKELTIYLCDHWFTKKATTKRQLDEKRQGIDGNKKLHYQDSFKCPEAFASGTGPRRSDDVPGGSR
jgi:hypothetical protein